jgi:hypothetical protein
LRQLAIHPDFAADLWCHHWTARSPRLPELPPASTGSVPGQAGNEQLCLTSLLRHS